MPKKKGFNIAAHVKATNTAVNKFKDNSKIVKLSGIQDKDQRSSTTYTTRVLTGANKKPMAMTYGVSKGNSGATVHKKGKAK